MPHVINRLQFETSCASEAEAFDLKGRVSSMQPGIAEIIDRVCSKYVTEEECISIDRIEIELGAFSLTGFEQKFTEALLAKFDNTIREKSLQVPLAERQEMARQSRLGQIIMFLETGHLPWWASGFSINLQEDLLQAAREDKTGLRQLLNNSARKSIVWQRLAYQFSPEVHTALLIVFPELEKIFQEVKEWQPALQEILQVEEKERAAGFPRITGESLLAFVISRAGYFLLHPVTNESRVKIARWLMAFLEIPVDENQQLPVALAEAIKKTGSAALPEPSVDKGTVVNAQEEEINDAGGEDAPEIPVRVVISKAGLVLLAPYFKTLFTELGWLEQDGWVNRQAMFRAIHLLHFLATGEQQPMEYELALEKIICGAGPETPVPAFLELSANELKEAQELLESVIKHWGALKNTSVNGLRSTFLIRDGILHKRENGWTLQVERKTADVLLETLPWSYSTLSFSWTDELIFVEW